MRNERFSQLILMFREVCGVIAGLMNDRQMLTNCPFFLNRLLIYLKYRKTVNFFRTDARFFPIGIMEILENIAN